MADPKYRRPAPDKDGLYEIAYVHGWKRGQGKNAEEEVWSSWDGYPPDEDTWESREGFSSVFFFVHFKKRCNLAPGDKATTKRIDRVLDGLDRKKCLKALKLLGGTQPTLGGGSYEGEVAALWCDGARGPIYVALKLKLKNSPLILLPQEDVQIVDPAAVKRFKSAEDPAPRAKKKRTDDEVPAIAVPVAALSKPSPAVKLPEPEVNELESWYYNPTNKWSTYVRTMPQLESPGPIDNVIPPGTVLRAKKVGVDGVDFLQLPKSDGGGYVPISKPGSVGVMWFLKEKEKESPEGEGDEAGTGEAEKKAAEPELAAEAGSGEAEKKGDES